jgi:hypothetical protein
MIAEQYSLNILTDNNASTKMKLKEKFSVLIKTMKKCMGMKGEYS